jgi:hypothetical protein
VKICDQTRASAAREVVSSNLCSGESPSIVQANAAFRWDELRCYRDIHKSKLLPTSEGIANEFLVRRCRWNCFVTLTTDGGPDSYLVLGVVEILHM